MMGFMLHEGLLSLCSSRLAWRHAAGANRRSSRDIKRGPPVKQPIRATVCLLAWPQARGKICFLLRKERFECPASSEEEISGSSQRELDGGHCPPITPGRVVPRAAEQAAQTALGRAILPALRMEQ